MRIVGLGLLFFITMSVGPAAGQSRSPAAGDSTWRDHDRAADSSEAHRDWPAFLHHVQVLDSLMHHHPGVTHGLARAYAQLGDTSRALQMLWDLSQTGVWRDLAKDSLLLPVHSASRWPTLLAAFAGNRNPKGSAKVVLRMADSAFAAEDLGYDKQRRRYVVSGILGRSLAAVGPDGWSSPLISNRTESPLWAVLAVGVDAERDRVWTTTVGDDRIPGLAKGDRPHASILRVNLASGAIERRFDLSGDGQPRETGDLGLAPNGDVVVSDGRFGTLYLISRTSDSLTTLVQPGILSFPQQPAFSSDGRVIVVPDYVLGLARVERATGRVSWLQLSRQMALNGIDGLTRMNDTTLIAVQNGVDPFRVLRLTLDPSWRSVIKADVLVQGGVVTDPTHGIMIDGHYVFIAHSGGAALLPDGTVRPGERLTAPVIAKLELTAKR